MYSDSIFYLRVKSGEYVVEGHVFGEFRRKVITSRQAWDLSREFIKCKTDPERLELKAFCVLKFLATEEERTSKYDWHSHFDPAKWWVSDE